MHQTTKTLSACLFAAFISGCSNSDFQPTAGTSSEQIFAEACAGCHGSNGEGKFGFLLAIAGSDLSPEEIVTKIRQGGHVMPAFPQIGEEQAAGIAALLIKPAD